MGFIITCRSKLKLTTRKELLKTIFISLAVEYNVADTDYTSGDIKSDIENLLLFTSDSSVSGVKRDNQVTRTLDDIALFNPKI